MREWRKTHPLTDEQKLKDRCRSYTAMLVRRGHLERKPCELCGSELSEAHHPDYSNPRLVIWLCRRCHLVHHAEEHELARVSQLPLIPVAV